MRPTLLPLDGLGPEAPRPESPHLRWVGPFSARIGRPLHAFSDVIEGGWNAGALPRGQTLFRLWLRAVGIACGLGALFGVVVLAVGFGIATLNHTEIGPIVVGATGLAVLSALAIALALRPEQSGVTALVGTEGIEMGEIDRGALAQVVSRYDEDDVVWLERRMALGPERGGAASVSGLLELRRREGMGAGPCLEARWALSDEKAARAPDARTAVLWALTEHGHPRRIEAARARLERGASWLLPAIDGRAIRICAGARLELVRRDGSVTPLTDVTLDHGLYTLRMDGGSETLARHTLGDAFLLDALVLAARGERPSITEAAA